MINCFCEKVDRRKVLTLKRLGGGQFSKNISSKEKAKLCLFEAFNIIISHTFPENFIEINQVVQEI